MRHIRAILYSDCPVSSAPCPGMAAFVYYLCFPIIDGASRVSMRQRTTFAAPPPTTLTLRASDFVGRAAV